MEMNASMVQVDSAFKVAGITVIFFCSWVSCVKEWRQGRMEFSFSVSARSKYLRGSPMRNNKELSTKKDKTKHSESEFLKSLSKEFLYNISPLTRQSPSLSF